MGKPKNPRGNKRGGRKPNIKGKIKNFLVFGIWAKPYKIKGKRLVEDK